MKPAFTLRPLFALLLLAPLAASAQDAKTLFERAKTEDSCPKVIDVCKAADLDPKKKDYREACDNSRGPLAVSDTSTLKTAQDAFDEKNFSKAARYAKYVCKFDQKQFADAQQLLTDIQKAQSPAAAQAPAAPAKADQSASLFALAQSQFDSGHFAEATASANQVTDPNLKGLANGIVQRIAAYNQNMQDAQAKERARDLPSAIQYYAAAQGLAANGPGDPGAHIRDLRAQQAASMQPQTTPTPNKPPPAATAQNRPPANVPQKPVEDDNARVARLLDEAGRAEKSNNLQLALKTYGDALRVQPANPDAAAGRQRIETAINRDPAEQAKTLAQAIRDFYSSKYSDTEDELTSYLSSTTARSRGAAYFYLGATRLCRQVLENPSQKAESAGSNPQVQKNFKLARDEHYQPVEKYVSPFILRAWKNGS